MVNAIKKSSRNERRNEERSLEKIAIKSMSPRSISRKADRNIVNQKSEFGTADEELEDRTLVATETLKVYKRYLPDILKNLANIKDPRNPRKTEHKFNMLMLYGIFSFVFNRSSRRAVDSSMSAVFMENMKNFFPELDTLPHSCTLARLLEDIDPMEIELITIKMVKKLISDKKLVNYMVNNKYVIAIDGVHKFTREFEWCKNSLVKHKTGQPEGVNQYYANALEASLVLPEGLTIPLMTEFMDRKEYSDKGTDTEKTKQDCELKAFTRLIARLKEYFPRLEIAVTLDGLYANGPLMKLCKKLKLDYMIVLKDKSLKTVWEEFESHKRDGIAHKHTGKVKNKVLQEFIWVNNIEFSFGLNLNEKILLNVVECKETYFYIDSKTGEEVKKESKFAWISFITFSAKNVERRCNEIGRPRWNIETQNLVEKYHGYAYSHCFSYNWNAMKGYHYLMHIAHLINVLLLNSKEIIGRVKKKGVRRFIEYLWGIFDGGILDVARIKKSLEQRYQFRLDI